MRKQILSTVLALCLAFPFLLLLAGCAAETSLILRVYNWEDYISEPTENDSEYVDLISKFEEEYEEKTGQKITVEYSTFGTNENMYNELQINPGSYDLV